MTAVERRAAPRRAFRRNRRTVERVKLLGAEVDLVRAEEVLHHLTEAIMERRRFVVANHNTHSLYLLQQEPALAAFFDEADLIELDSTPMVFFARLLGLQSRRFHRCTYLDWREHFWSLAQRNGWRVFYLGGAPGVAIEAAERIAVKRPGVILGARDGYFTEADNDDVLEDIRAFDPHVVFVGMGMPRQELWIQANKNRLPPCALLSVGAAFDYEAGVQRAAPRWAGRLGVEWLFRLIVDPKRLFVRYCIEPWRLLGLAFGDLIGSLRLRMARRGR